MKKSFTLLEVLISITVIVVGIVGILTLMQQATSFLPLSEQRLTASYLAQEGMEIVRNFRDLNIVNGQAWDNGLTSCGAGCEADYSSTGLTNWDNRFLLDNNGFYDYSSGPTTLYKRKITIIPAVDVLEVTVEVFWQEKTRDHSFKTKENLYNWY